MNGINIKFFDYGLLTPKKDVTAYESVLLSMLIAAVLTNPAANYSSFIKENDLERHFTRE